VSLSVLALASEDREMALEWALAAVSLEGRTRMGWNSHAAQIWWSAKLFGDDVVGGTGVVGDARDRLEAHHWGQAVLEPELIMDAVPVPRADATAVAVDDR
jgi:hypothetical protein